MTRETYLGIDLGTSGVKAALIDPTGTVVAEAHQPLSVSRPHPGWSEQGPEDWWQATLAALDALAAKAPKDMAALRGLGLSGQMHGAVLLDAADAVLRPAILWNDMRSAEECAALETDAPDLHAITGNLAMPGFTAPKLIWVARHEPAIFEKVAKVLLPKDYLRLRLTGEHISEMSDAAGTLWLDVGRRDWSDTILAATGLARNHMPALVEGTAVAGALRAELRARWGISSPVPVAGGGGDNAASACGIGAITPGKGFVSLGTSGVLFVADDRFSPNTAGAVHSFCHALPGMWHQMGVILSASDSLNWIANLVGRDVVELTGSVARGYRGPGEEIFLPYLSGERTPHNDATARGSFTGLSHLSTAESMTQAVMEGVAFAFRDCQRVLAEAGTRVDQLIAVGGGSRSRLWLEMIATNLDTEILLPEAGDYGAAFGAARLGLCAATNAAPSEICTAPAIAERIAPRADLRVAFDAQYARYRALHPAIRDARKSGG
ncbi:xylulokinase [Thioclava marina]|uniref:Xylulose kinase n=1 Tax=Thioclava marina TaxID=1915077 RepID=A0ABX3MHW7_9RHOB|nr:xylulokinase [Thioclava marina]OOY10952.1 xylulokinase [Thioclava marina]